MINITKRTELMFAQAVALAQNGKMKSHIHAEGNVLFIANMDNTLLFRFETDQTFPAPGLNFFANDYVGPDLEMTNDAVTFITTRAGYTQRKTCGLPKTTFAEMQAIWEKHQATLEYPILLKRDLLTLLDSDLSHTEVYNDHGNLKLIQRNIFTGATIEVVDASNKGGFFSMCTFPPDYTCMGIRTSDFQALFQFATGITFYLQPGAFWIRFRDPTGTVNGILAGCIYDEIGYLTDTFGGK
jgi:hypothetical protein